MDPVLSDIEKRKRRRSKKRMDEESIDSVSTISKTVETGETLKQSDGENKKNNEPTCESSLEEHNQGHPGKGKIK